VGRRQTGGKLENNAIMGISLARRKEMEGGRGFLNQHHMGKWWLI
jgi:hypothetical protein